MPVCSLCSTAITRLKVSAENKLFCCHGCQAVYQILESASALEGYENHPVFRQALKFGLISNDNLLEQLQKTERSLEKRKWHLEIQNMWCASCSELIRLVLLRNKGVSSCIVDYATDLASIEFYPQLISKENLSMLIQSLGYKPSELQNNFNTEISRSIYNRFLLASFCALNVMMFAYPLYAITLSFEKEGVGDLFAKLSLFFSLPVATYCAFPIYKRFYHGMKMRFFGMEALVTFGVISSFVLSIYELSRGSINVYFDSMTVIVAFVLLGKIIEGKAKFSSKEMLFRLHRSLPQKARKIVDGKEKLISLKEVKIGDYLVAHGGEKIVLDGLIEQGQAACDESIMTGESLPLLKQPGMRVIAGAIVQSGSITYRVEKLSEQSAMQKIIAMIEQDVDLKTRNFNFGDRIATLFTPMVILIALFICIYQGPLAAIAVLLISCPCAIGIAAPLAESHLIMQLASNGAIIRNRHVLQWLGKETVYVFDKTGTVTEGKFNVIEGLDNLNPQQLAIIKSMTAYSAHPLSYAMHQSIQAEKMVLEHIEEIPGKGLRTIIDGKSYLLGSARLLEEEGIKVPVVNTSLTPVFFAGNEAPVVLLLGDQIREEAKKLRSLTPKKLILLSGDHAQVVEKIAKELQFDDWRAEMTPLEKKIFIEDLKQKGQIVFMVGDGINDAPAIATADIGASLISASEMSIQVSDILLTDSLDVIKTICQLGIQGNKILKQNFFWAFFYNCIGIALAMAGRLSPIFSAFAMTASSLIVLFNSRRIKPNPK